VPHDFFPDVRDLLRTAGCHHVRTGKHQIWYSPVSQRHVAVPNPIKSRHTANGILKEAGLPKVF
jgi:hypothetical protein